MVLVTRLEDVLYHALYFMAQLGFVPRTRNNSLFNFVNPWFSVRAGPVGQ